MTGDCPIDEPNVWMATVEADDLYIRVNPVICYTCLISPTPNCRTAPQKVCEPSWQL